MIICAFSDRDDLLTQCQIVNFVPGSFGDFTVLPITVLLTTIRWLIPRQLLKMGSSKLVKFPKLNQTNMCLFPSKFTMQIFLRNLISFCMTNMCLLYIINDQAKPIVIPPAKRATNITAQDQISAGSASYGFLDNTSGAI